MFYCITIDNMITRLLQMIRMIALLSGVFLLFGGLSHAVSVLSMDTALQSLYNSAKA